MLKVNILMSTYNGEKYIEEQIQSILNQEEVIIKLYIRDDGSTDNTVKIIESFNKENIVLFKMSNIGWKKSFLELTKLVEYHDDEYYAFSDQDDVWKKNKISIAINYLEEKKSSSQIRAYCSNQSFVDNKLNKIDYKISKKFTEPDLYHVIVNGFGMGCTEVFSSELFRLIKNSKYNGLNITHDVIVSVLGTYFGEMHRDDNSYILYRQHSDNAGSTHQSFLNKIINSFNFKDIFIIDNVLYLLENFEDLMTNSQKSLILCFLNMDKLKNKIRLIFNKKVSRDTFFGTLKIKLYILLYRKGEKK
ncbi:glycosyltransferase [Thomasclavelia ramosa]|uniref:Glycosyltransferase n=1 Tax=Thomasclavelia ramosa TaxID=1547 RepID=A0A3E3ED86_9FIRM|nr:glycosyltransferase [Thomasclavelia ramosa]RGD85489.1 glycosyltransferase [Thomasclavelia ramosa]